MTDIDKMSREQFYEEITRISRDLAYKEENYEKFLDSTIRENIGFLLKDFRPFVFEAAMKGSKNDILTCDKKTWFDIKNKIFIKSENIIFSFDTFSHINVYSIALNKFYQESLRELFPKPFEVSFTHAEESEKVILKISWVVLSCLPF